MGGRPQQAGQDFARSRRQQGKSIDSEWVPTPESIAAAKRKLLRCGIVLEQIDAPISTELMRITRQVSAMFTEAKVSNTFGKEGGDGRN